MRPDLRPDLRPDPTPFPGPEALLAPDRALEALSPHTILDPQDVAILLGVNVRAVYRWADKGWLPCFKVKNRRYFKGSDLVKALRGV